MTHKKSSCLVILTVLLCTSESLRLNNDVLQEDPAVAKLRTYLRIRTVHPNPELGYEQAIQWLREQADELGLDFHFVQLGDPNLFALWMTWNGSDPRLQSILLNSHMDVVAVEPEKWEHHPFEAFKDKNGNIYGRGASDMKSTTVAELEAIQRLKNSGFQPLRTIHVSIMPDEELTGKRGMMPFVQSTHFKNLNVGIGIDEGFKTDEKNLMHITYAEKSIWQFNITVKGHAAHAYNLPEYTAAHRMQIVINKLLEFRQSEYKKLETLNETMDHLTILNLVRMGGGSGNNIIPSGLWATFDMRIWLKPEWNYTDVENMLLNIIEEAKVGPIPNDVSISFIVKSLESGKTIANNSNVWWTVMQDTCHQLNITCKPFIHSAATDGRYIRSVNIPVFGISPFPDTRNTAHQDNEFINEHKFLQGIDRYMAFIKNLASLPEELYP